jgi:hypothetical protein
MVQGAENDRLQPDRERNEDTKERELLVRFRLDAASADECTDQES